MSAFYQNLSRWGEAIAVSYPSSSGLIQSVSYQQFQRACDDFLARLAATSPSLVAISCQNDFPTLVAYFACLQAKHPMLLLDAQLTQAQQQSLLEKYKIQYLIESQTLTKLPYHKTSFDPKLALLLSTSGSTGTPKQVALSYQNIDANTHSICAYLPIQATDSALTTLPFNYSYGLSVIHTHIAKGARLVLSPYSVVDKGFWQLMESEKISTIAGVPYTYEMLIRLGLLKKEWPFLRYFTQAGGKLDEKRALMLAQYAKSHQKDFYVMYGQTEATARMAYVSLDTLLKKPATIGKPIEKGAFSLIDSQGQKVTKPHLVGELVYQGPNVMLGYVESAAALTKLEHKSMLNTGDLACFDEQGDYFIVGRLKRFIKVYGKRIALDDIEQMVFSFGCKAYAFGEDNQLHVAVLLNNETDNSALIAKLLKHITSELSIHHSTVKITSVGHLPKTSNGKPDYEAIKTITNPE